jgi:hypothetical protein
VRNIDCNQRFEPLNYFLTPPLIQLPGLAAFDIACRNPAALPAICVDADQVAEVEKFAVGLWRVANDGDFA